MSHPRASDVGRLILSLFPGIGLLDMAFEEEGFCVVRGPDLLWGGDIRRFHPPAGKFDGVIGGPPCQEFSTLAALNEHIGNRRSRHGNLIPEFERVVVAALPDWFVMENVPKAPEPEVRAYHVHSELVEDVAVGGLTQRTRRFSFGIHGDYGTCDCGHSLMDHENDVCVSCSCCQPRIVLRPAILPLFAEEARRTVTGDARVHTTGHRIRSRLRGGGTLPNTGAVAPLTEMLESQGLPASFFCEDSPFTSRGKRQMIGNGVPLPMGRAVARAVKRALGIEVEA